MSHFWRSRLEGKDESMSLWGDLNLPSLVKTLAKARGFEDAHQLQQWLNPKLSNLKDPMLLKGMSLAVQRVLLALKHQEVVALYGDFDLDGTSALALLEKAFRFFGFKNLVVYQPSRLNEGYGFHDQAVQSLKENKNVSLIITADVGITSLSAAKRCHDLNVDLIITDHHLPLSELPQAFSIINPNQKGCESGLGHLCGVGVAFYLVWALRRQLMSENQLHEGAFDLKELLDCFAIGTLTDMVPLIDENRLLVKHGLITLAKTNRIGIRLLIEKLYLSGRELSSQDVAIRLAPKLNALSRMELNLRPLDLFLIENKDEAEKLVKIVLSQNDLRLNLQAEAEKLAISYAHAWENEPFIFICHENFHKGVIGLVATKLTILYQKPVFIGSIDAESNLIVASGRAPNDGDWNLVNALESAAEFLHRFGGHTHAAGFEFKKDSIEDIIKLLKNFFLTLGENTKPQEIFFDAEISLAELNSQTMSWLQAMGPFGQSFEPPLFLFSGLEMAQSRQLKGGHWRLTLIEPATSFALDALLFSPSTQQIDIMQQEKCIDILAEPQWNYFQNQKSVQLLIKELRAKVVKNDKLIE